MRYLLLMVTLTSFWGCGEDEDRFEVINKLRGIGVSAQDKPIVLNPSEGTTQSAVLTAHALLPKGQSVTEVSAYTDSGAGFSFPGEVLVDEASAQVTTIGALESYQVPFTVTFSSVPTAYFNSDGQETVARVRYGVLLKSGAEEEAIVGDLVVVADTDSKALTEWQNHALELISPAQGAARSSQMALEGKLTKAQDEPVKLRWFVSSGKVKNYRDQVTDWEEVGEGEQTVVLVALASKSKFISILPRVVGGEALR